MKYDVSVVADLCLDILVTGKVKPIYGQVEQLIEDYAIDLGGSSAIFASQFTKLGGSVGLSGCVGNDSLGQILLDNLNILEISTKNILKKSEYKTAIGFGLSYFDDRAMLTYTGTIAAIQPSDILNSNILEETGHFHIAGYFLLDQLINFWPEVLKSFQNKGISTSLDTNWSPDNNWDSVINILPYIDVFLPNEQEAMHISKKANINEAGKWLAGFCDFVVIKRGENGCIAFHEGEIMEFKLPVNLTKNLKIADTTGAGDNFDAGFLREWLLGKPLVDCVNMAMKCGTLSLSKIGGIAGQYQLNTKPDQTVL